MRALASFILLLCTSCASAVHPPASGRVDPAPAARPTTPATPQRISPVAYPPFQSLALGPDGQLLACAPGRGVMLFDLPRQTMGDLSTVDGPYYDSGYTPGTAAFRACAVTFRDGIPTALVDHTSDCLVRWNVSARKIIDETSDSSARFDHVAFTADGSRLVAVSTPGTVYEWRVADGVVLHHWRATPYVSALALTPDGSQLWIASRSRSTLWDLQGEQLVRTITDPGLNSIALFPDGPRGIAHNGKTMWMWDLDRHRPVHIFGPSQSVREYRYSKDGTRMLTSSFGPVSVWNTAQGGLLHSLSSPATQGWVYGIDVSADGRRALTGSGANAMELWDLETGKPLSQYPHPAYVSFVAFMPDGHHAVSISGRDYNGGATARVWDLDSGQVLRSFQAQRDIAEVASLSPRGDVLVTSGDGSRVLKMWSTERGELIRSLTSPLAGVTSMQMAPASPRSVTGDVNGILRVWSDKGLKLERSVLAHAGAIAATAVSSEGRRALTSGGDGTTRLWDLDTGALLHHFEQGTTALAFDRAGECAFVGSPDGTVVEWNVAAGRQVGAMTAAVPCGAVATTPDGTTVVTGHADGSLRIWSRATHELETTRQGRPVAIVGLAVSSRQIACAAGDGTLTLRPLQGEGAATVAAANSEWIAYTDDGDYVGSQGAEDLVSLWEPTGWRRWATWEKAGRRPERVLAAIGAR